MNAKPTRVAAPPHPLAEKVVKGGPNAVDVETLDRAEQVIADASGDYLKWVEEDLEKLRSALGDLAASDKGQEAGLRQLFDVAHEMKGQGGSFGYDLMTVIADHMCRFIDRLDGMPSKAEIEVLQLYVDSLHVVIAKGLTADGGPEGKRLLDGLAKVSAKHS